jgi:2-polyprenyl-3-methyl-5-hydroxy-6-metoxy-1,4-benzoquinol methylase
MAAACGVCESRQWRLEREICGRRFVRCGECSTTRLLDRVAEARLNLLYSRSYPGVDLAPAALEAQLANPTFDFRRRRLESAIGPRARRIFEIGCGDGNFLASLQRSGWTVAGSEFDATAAATASRRHGLDLRTLDERGLDAAFAPFEVIAAYHVLEHIYAPREWLSAAARNLAPGGLLHIQVPNYASITRRVTGEAWASWVFPQHVYLYTPATLATLLRTGGFAVQSMTTWDPWHGPGTVAGTLFNIAQRARGRPSPWSAELTPEAESRAATPPAQSSASRRLGRSVLCAVSDVIARAEAALGRGAVIDVLAVSRSSLPSGHSSDRSRA